MARRIYFGQYPAARMHLPAMRQNPKTRRIPGQKVVKHREYHTKGRRVSPRKVHVAQGTRLSIQCCTQSARSTSREVAPSHRPCRSRPMALARSAGVWTTSVRPFKRATAALMTSVSCCPVGASGGGGTARAARPPRPPDGGAALAPDESLVCWGGGGGAEAAELEPVEAAEPDGEPPTPGEAGLARAAGISSVTVSTGMMRRGTGRNCT